MTLIQPMNAEFSYLKDVNFCHLPCGTVIASNIQTIDTVFVLVFSKWKTMVHGTSMTVDQRILLVRKGQDQISWLFQNVQWFYKIPWHFQAWRIAFANWLVFHEREKPAQSLGIHIYYATANCIILSWLIGWTWQWVAIWHGIHTDLMSI